MTIKQIESSIAELKKRFTRSISSTKSLDDVYAVRSEFLSKDSELQKIFGVMRDVDAADRAKVGALVNDAKQYFATEIESALALITNKEALLRDEVRDIDVTAPFHVNNHVVPSLPGIGSVHPMQYEISRMLEIFSSMGFQPFEGRELDSDYYVFDSLNMPKNHPARQNWDTFRTDDNLIPTPHTSNMQVRIMRQLKTAPLRAVIYGRCSRNEATDAVHGHTFYQIEGLYIDKGISISNMIATIKAFVEAFFDRPIVGKIQPGYFPFVEPAIEYMVRCVFCEGVGCGCCKHTGWLEVLGAGMIHPNVLREGGFDPAVYSGFAWGLGLDRMVMQRNGIQDIRSLFGSDIRFLQSKV